VNGCAAKLRNHSRKGPIIGSYRFKGAYVGCFVHSRARSSTPQAIFRGLFSRSATTSQRLPNALTLALLFAKDVLEKIRVNEQKANTEGLNGDRPSKIIRWREFRKLRILINYQEIGWGVLDLGYVSSLTDTALWLSFINL
jgi:hypothetical protein